MRFFEFVRLKTNAVSQDRFLSPSQPKTRNRKTKCKKIGQCFDKKEINISNGNGNYI